MPLVGMSCRLDAMLMIACRPNCTRRPVAASTTKRLLSCSSREKPRSTMKAKSATMMRQAMSPSSSPATAKTKSAWASGRIFLHRAFARAASPQPAIHEGVHRAVDLVAVAAGGIEEAVDAARHVRQERNRRRPARRHRRPRRAPTQTRRKPARKNCVNHTADDHRGHAEIGLLDEQADDQDEKRDGDPVAGKARAQPASREQPGRDHGEGRLDELRGLQREARQRRSSAARP